MPACPWDPAWAFFSVGSRVRLSQRSARPGPHRAGPLKQAFACWHAGQHGTPCPRKRVHPWELAAWPLWLQRGDGALTPPRSAASQPLTWCSAPTGGSSQPCSEPHRNCAAAAASWRWCWVSRKRGVSGMQHMSSSMKEGGTQPSTASQRQSRTQPGRRIRCPSPGEPAPPQPEGLSLQGGDLAPSAWFPLAS